MYVHSLSWDAAIHGGVQQEQMFTGHSVGIPREEKSLKKINLSAFQHFLTK